MCLSIEKLFLNVKCFFSLFSEPKKDKLENGGEMMRPERPNSLTAGKHARRVCYQGDVGELQLCTIFLVN